MLPQYSRDNKHVAVFGDADIAHFSRPVIDVLKQMPVNGFEVPEIEIARREFFVRSRVAYFRFKCIEFVSVREIELVLQNGRVGIAVLVGNSVIHRQATLCGRL